MLYLFEVCFLLLINQLSLYCDYIKSMDYNFKNIGENVVIYEPVAIMEHEMIWLENHIIISEFAYVNGGIY